MSEATVISDVSAWVTKMPASEMGRGGGGGERRWLVGNVDPVAAPPPCRGVRPGH